ncbi:hypothetical protein [Pontibacillus yanchengensis]|nr:hypothetical protein [Pontibacillus yanchengensis]
MKRYALYIVLFGFFFPLSHKIALVIMMIFYKEDAYALISYYHDYGLLSIRNLIISLIAGLMTYFVINVFTKWELDKKK